MSPSDSGDDLVPSGAPNHRQNGVGPTTIGLPAMDVSGRMARLRDRFAAADVDGLLVTKLINVRYLTGFTGSAGLLLVLADEPVNPVR